MTGRNTGRQEGVMQGSLVREAESEYLRGNYQAAVELYEQLGTLLGNQYFEANIRLCERRLSQDQGAPALQQLRLAAVMDDFTHHAFEPECRLLPLSAATWHQDIVEFQPDIVFIESAWRGLDDSWEKKVSQASGELRALVKWARDHNVPTLLWCKEDPVHFSRFLPVARMVDHVFTTDMDCIAKYKRAVGHERVYFLPFAAQISMHNPMATVQRREGFSFAGSWYPHYLERQADFRTLVSVARKLKWVEIYDRNGNRPPPHDFAFPEEFHGEIRGTLPYTEMDKGCKGYRYGITVNTVKQSQTMFARRALELMASNTVVVSNFSKGLRQLFGDLVVASDDAGELEGRLAPLVGNDAAYRKLRLQALRKVLTEHTYTQRLAYIVGKVFNRSTVPPAPRVALLAEASTQEEAALLVAAMERQARPRVVLLLVGPRGICSHSRVVVVESRQAAWHRAQRFDYVAPICSGDYYGKHYLNDLVLATSFAGGAGVTKASFHALAAGGHVVERDGGQEYVPVRRAALRRSLLPQGLLQAGSQAGPQAASHAASQAGPAGGLQAWAENPALRLEDACIEADSLIAVDAFSYCADGAGSETVAAIVDADDVQRTGASLPQDMQPRAQRVRALKVDERVALEAEDWLPLVPPKSIHKSMKLSLGDDSLVHIDSKLAPEEYKYVYLSREFPPQEVTMRQDFGFIVHGDAQLDIRLVFVFLDGNGQKISHYMHTLGMRDGIALPPGTAAIRLGMRVQGGGQAKIGRIVLLEACPPEFDLLPCGRQLVVSRQYPSYDDLYRFGFVHSRVKAYNRSGWPTEVMRITMAGGGKFREFENVDVVDAQVGQLKHALASGTHDSVAVHICDRPIWNAVREQLDHVRVVIWAHGSEIQPWWRRATNHSTDDTRNASRRTSDARMVMWREILTLRHPNLTVAFISDNQAMEALSDLRLSMDSVGNIAVIHNFVDGDLFEYLPKAPEQRFDLLSIRPYASTVYANDLTVRAIQALAQEPFFSQLRIRLVGDGPLFDDTVEPLRQYPNVTLHKGFLLQREIAALHREYGIFLVPSRADSQGVSRDEAMASGLVPVTTRVAAIPQFVDEHCGIMAEPEDALGLAAGVRRLVENPATFLSMSRAAAERVRAQSSYRQTVSQELALLSGRGGDTVNAVADQRLLAQDLSLTDVALYGDVNLNIMDGSAIWAASLAEVLSGLGNLRVSVVLKARVHRTQVISRLLDLTPAVRLIEPELPDARTGLSQADAVAWLARLDGERPFRAFIMRGLEVCLQAARSPCLTGRLWAYLTDIPQQAELLDAESRSKIETIIGASEYILCQTPEMMAYFARLFPQAASRTRLLPPMVPAANEAENARQRQEIEAATPFRYCYAGKFAPRWGIRELFEAHESLRGAVADAELHVFGDKIHNPADDPDFRPLVQRRLEAGAGLQWHGALDRDALMRRLQGMHASWAFRDPRFEHETLELSTKVLEYASLGVPMILARSAVFEGVLGKDYPLFAATCAQAGELLHAVATSRTLRADAGGRLRDVAQRYTFDAVRRQLDEQKLFSE
ncbi:methyltransferase type 12 [Achromobacter sp. HZ28]|nr:methyltransferase type 12 [Achromobacter sp. HZ34]OWT73959.1 methyltransferase type 12 [Achromobacter sp. HZ28]